MAEFGRWQWDDAGTWRDFSEQFQAEMEAGFQKKVESVKISILNVGEFRIDIRRMTQVSLTGRNPGYERSVRRQVKRIHIGYFILGEQDDMFTSDSVIDQIQELPVLHALASLLRKMIAEPELLGFFSVNLDEDEYRDTLGSCDEVVEFLSERGFQVMEEAGATFLVFMQEGTDTAGLSDALKDVEARQSRLSKSRKPTNAPVPSNSVESNSLESDVGPSNSMPSNDVESKEESSNKVVSNEQSSNEVRRQAKLVDEARPKSEPMDKGAGGKRSQGKQGKGGRGCRIGKGKPKDGAQPRKVWRAKTQEELQHEGASEPEIGQEGKLQLVLPSGERAAADLEEDTLECLLQVVKKLTNLRMPAVEVKRLQAPPLGLAAEPGTSLRLAAQLKPRERLVVSDFEASFVDRLQSGLLRIQDLASLAPLLDWERQELTQVLLNRLRMLLEGSCDAWCVAAGCNVEDELACGRALLKRLYDGKPLEVRLEVVRRLLPDMKGMKAELKVERAGFLQSAISGLSKFTCEELRGTFTVTFVGESAEDHGGPRRDFFGNFGPRLSSELPVFWRRTPLNMLVPTADLAAEISPKELGQGLGIPEIYRACGRACALALKHGDVLGDEFAVFFVHQVARDKCVSLRELQRQLAESSGPDFRANSDLLRQSLSETGLKGITLSRELSGTNETVELVPGGRETPVTEDNKKLWLELHLKNKLYDSLQKAADAFRDGLLDIAGGSHTTCPLLSLLTPPELVKLWAGSDVDPEGLQQWQDVAVVSDEVKQQADWLWEMLKDSDDKFRGLVLKFSTGNRRLGREGLQRFEIQPYDGDDEQLPHAMTCGNMLQLPRYSSKEAMQRQLTKVVTEHCEGFGII